MIGYLSLIVFIATFVSRNRLHAGLAAQGFPIGDEWNIVRTWKAVSQVQHRTAILRFWVIVAVLSFAASLVLLPILIVRVAAIFR